MRADRAGWDTITTRTRTTHRDMIPTRTRTTQGDMEMMGTTRTRTTQGDMEMMGTTRTRTTRTRTTRPQLHHPRSTWTSPSSITLIHTAWGTWTAHLAAFARTPAHPTPAFKHARTSRNHGLRRAATKSKLGSAMRTLQTLSASHHVRRGRHLRHSRTARTRTTHTRTTRTRTTRTRTTPHFPSPPIRMITDPSMSSLLGHILQAPRNTLKGPLHATLGYPSLINRCKASIYHHIAVQIYMVTHLCIVQFCRRLKWAPTRRRNRRRRQCRNISCHHFNRDSLLRLQH